MLMYVSPILKSCIHVFVCNDAVQKPLQKPYNGPYKVQKCSEQVDVLPSKNQALCQLNYCK